MTNESRYEIRQASIVDRELQIEWADGHHSNFHPIWLRHQCECEQCGTPMNAVRDLRIHHIPDNIFPVQLTFDPAQVHLNWSNDNHASCYTARWLRDHCYSEFERARRKHRPILWDATIEQDPPTFDYHTTATDSRIRLKMLQAICDYGFCKVENLSPDSSKAYIELVGQQRQTHFGTYKLSKKNSINNVGDVTSELPPHCDETYRTSTVGITVFQVIRPSQEGGHSTLVDGFEAARRFSDLYPEDFALLARTPIRAQRYDPDHAEGELPRWYICNLPMIQLDNDGDISGIRVNERQISPLDLPADQVDACYRAIRRFLAIIYQPALLIRFPLQAGQGLIFNNQRVLHGRTAFNSEQPGRSVLTSSVDLEDFYSNLRMLSLQHDSNRTRQTYAQGLVV